MERRRTRESRQAREARMAREAMEAIEEMEAREATEARMAREEWKLMEKRVEELFIFFVVSLFLMWWFFAPVRDPPIREEVVDVKPKHHIVNVGLDIPIKEYPIEVLRTDELIICSIPLELSWQYLWSSASVHVKSHLSCATIEKDANITDLTSNLKSSFLEMVNPFAWIMWAVRKPEVMQDNCNHEIRVPFVRPFCSIFKFDVPSHLFYMDEIVSINYVLNQFDPILIAYSICGVLLWFLAGFLSKNQYFQFFCQVATIVFFSIVIAIFFIVNSFDIKKKIGAMAILTCSVPLIYKFWIPAIWNIVITFKTLTAIYLLTTTSASMVYFYVQGPIENPRIHNLIKLGIQFVATRLLFMGMTTRIIPLCVILAFFISPTLYELDKSYKLTSSFESAVISSITKIKKRFFPEPRKLLSHDEYELQLDEFTYKSLIDLKNYCLSPNCNLREILSRLSKPEKMVHFFTDSQSLLDLDAKEVDEYKEYIISNDLHITED